MRKITFLFLLFVCTISYGQYLTEGFEAKVMPPTNWNLASTSVNTWVIEERAGKFKSGTAGAAMFYHATDAQNETLTTPSLDLTGATNPRLKFWTAQSYTWAVTNNNYDVKVSVKDNTTSTTTQVWTETDLGTFADEEWILVTIDLTAYVGKSDVQIEFNYTGTDGDFWFIDDILVEEKPSCDIPTNLTVANITKSSADISWSASPSGETAWEYVVQAKGTGTPSGAGTATSATTANITSLTANTAYEVYVRANCGSDFGTWLGPVNFTTACNTVGVPYVQNFENGGEIPECMAMEGGEDWLFINDPTNMPSATHVGNAGNTTGGDESNRGYFAVIDDSGSDAPSILSTPFIDASSLTKPELTFFEISNNEGNANATLKVEVYDGDSWETVGTYNTNTTGWEKKTIDLSTLTIVGDIKVRFEVTDSGSFYDDIAIDDIEVKEAPTCRVPTDLTITSITQTGASFGWTKGGSETSWEYIVQTAGTTAPTSADSGTLTTNNPTNLTGLSSKTSYEVYVRAKCDATEFSEWSSAKAFTTACDAVVAPYIQNFENGGVIPDCMTMEGGEDWLFINDPTNMPTNTHVGNAGDTTGGDTTSGGYFAVVDDSGSEAPSMISTPFIDVSSLTKPELTFYEISNNEGNANATLKVEVYDGDSWETVGTYNTNTTGWEKKTIDLSTLTIVGDIKVRFEVTDSGSFYDDIAIDDISVAESATANITNLLAKGFESYPNPVTNELNLTANTAIKKVVIIDMLGKVVLEELPNITRAKVNTTKLNRGVYIVKVVIDDKVGTYKIVKK